MSQHCGSCMHVYYNFFIFFYCIFLEWTDNAVSENEKSWFLLPNLHWQQMGSLLFIISRDRVHGNVGKLIIKWCRSSLFNYVLYFQVSMPVVIIIKNRHNWLKKKHMRAERDSKWSAIFISNVSWSLMVYMCFCIERYYKKYRSSMSLGTKPYTGTAPLIITSKKMNIQS